MIQIEEVPVDRWYKITTSDGMSYEVNSTMYGLIKKVIADSTEHPFDEIKDVLDDVIQFLGEIDLHDTFNKPTADWALHI